MVAKPDFVRVQLVVGALLFGQLAFAIIVVVMTGQSAEPYAAETAELLAIPAATFAVVMIPIAFVIRGIVFKRAIGGSTEPSPAELMQNFQAGTIMFHAMLEGAVLLNLVVWLLGSEPWPSAAAVALTFVVALASFPRVPPDGSETSDA